MWLLDSKDDRHEHQNCQESYSLSHYLLTLCPCLSYYDSTLVAPWDCYYFLLQVCLHIDTETLFERPERRDHLGNYVGKFFIISADFCNIFFHSIKSHLSTNVFRYPIYTGTDRWYCYGVQA